MRLMGLEAVYPKPKLSAANLSREEYQPLSLLLLPQGTPQPRRGLAFPQLTHWRRLASELGDHPGMVSEPKEGWLDACKIASAAGVLPAQVKLF
jgi:hypothetical protein